MQSRTGAVRRMSSPPSREEGAAACNSERGSFGVCARVSCLRQAGAHTHIHTHTAPNERQSSLSVLEVLSPGVQHSPMYGLPLQDGPMPELPYALPLLSLLLSAVKENWQR